jgi:hypothetical protein
MVFVPDQLIAKRQWYDQNLIPAMPPTSECYCGTKPVPVRLNTTPQDGLFGQPVPVPPSEAVP